MSNVTFSGFDKLLADFDKLPELLARKIARDAMKEAMEFMKEQAKHNAPVDKGELRDSIIVKPGKTKNGIITVNVVAGTNHAFPVEFGSIHNTPDPFMRRTADSKGDQVGDMALEIMADKVEQELNG